MDRCSEGARSLPLQGPSDLAYVELGPHRASTQGSKRLGTQYWAGGSSDWLKLKKSWNTGGEAARGRLCNRL